MLKNMTGKLIDPKSSFLFPLHPELSALPAKYPLKILICMRHIGSNNFFPHCQIALNCITLTQFKLVNSIFTHIYS